MPYSPYHHGTGEGGRKRDYGGPPYRPPYLPPHLRNRTTYSAGEKRNDRDEGHSTRDKKWHRDDGRHHAARGYWGYDRWGKWGWQEHHSPAEATRRRDVTPDREIVEPPLTPIRALLEDPDTTVSPYLKMLDLAALEEIPTADTHSRTTVEATTTNATSFKAATPRTDIDAKTESNTRASSRKPKATTPTNTAVTKPKVRNLPKPKSAKLAAAKIKGKAAARTIDKVTGVRGRKRAAKIVEKVVTTTTTTTTTKTWPSGKVTKTVTTKTTRSKGAAGKAGTAKAGTKGAGKGKK